VFRNLSHQLSFGRSRGFKCTVLTNTCKGWHLFFTSVTNSFMTIYFFLLPGQVWERIFSHPTDSSSLQIYKRFR
jgi:hypothetical protein